MSEAATQQNHGATRRDLDEAGFEKIVSQPLSQSTVMLHTRTLSNSEEFEFREWANEQEHITEVGEDLDGYIYRWNI